MSNEIKGRREFGKYIRTTKDKIEVVGGEYLNQNKCHKNAVHFARVNDEDKIAMVMVIDSSDYGYLHFVNISAEGIYIDNTMGSFAVYDNEDYYLIKLVDKTEFHDIMTIFNNYITEAKSHIHWWTRFKLGDGRVC